MNKDLAKAFRLAREEIRADRNWYICNALESLYQKNKIQGFEYDQARAVIQNRLGVGSVECWLRLNVPEFKSWCTSADYCDQVMVDYRCRWLDSLVKEFS